MELTLSYTRINFFCWKHINIEGYIHDTTTVGAVANMIDELRPAMDICVDVIPNNPDHTLVIRQYLEEELGADNIRGRLRVYKHEGQFRISCLDLETFLRVLKLVRKNS